MMKFPTLDVLTVHTGRLVSDRGIDAVYELCDFMLDDQLYTHQLANAADVCAPELEKQHPWLAGLELPAAGDLPALQELCARVVEKHGDRLDVEQIADPAWVRGNAMNDLAKIMEGRKQR